VLVFFTKLGKWPHFKERWSIFLALKQSRLFSCVEDAAVPPSFPMLLGKSHYCRHSVVPFDFFLPELFVLFPSSTTLHRRPFFRKQLALPFFRLPHWTLTAINKPQKE